MLVKNIAQTNHFWGVLHVSSKRAGRFRRFFQWRRQYIGSGFNVTRKTRFALSKPLILAKYNR
jgi:hypothetical protein